MKPQLLIASPQLSDDFFEGAVVLLWHHDENGAIGVILNRPLEHSLAEVLVDDGGVDLAAIRGRVCWGGPVDPESGTLVTPSKIDDEEGWTINDTVGISRSQDVLQRLLKAGDPLNLYLGYAGWGAGQLDDEIHSGGWLYAEPVPELVFSQDLDTLYDRSLAQLGLRREHVMMTPIEA